MYVTIDELYTKLYKLYGFSKAIAELCFLRMYIVIGLE